MSLNSSSPFNHRGGQKRTSSGTIKKPLVDSTGWCYTRCKEDTRYSFAWTIEGFRRKMETFANGQFLTSHEFKVTVDGKETGWKLECFPNGKQKSGEDTVGAVSVFLYPTNHNSINRSFSFAIGFVNEDSSRVMRGKGDHCFGDNQNGWGWLKLVTHQTLRGEGRDNSRPDGEKLLPNDCLNILCVMTFRGEDHTTSGSSRPALVSTLIGNSESEDDELLVFGGGRSQRNSPYVSRGNNEDTNYMDLLDTGDLADIEIECDGVKFRCHSAILAGRSSVFKAMLLSDMKEKATKQISLKDIEVETCRAILHYCYGGQIANFSERAARILKAADQYDLLNLKRRCEISLCRSVNIENCLDYLIIADLHSTPVLKSLVKKFVVENAQELIEQPLWKEKITAYPDIFTEVFSELAKQNTTKKIKSESFSGWHSCGVGSPRSRSGLSE